jgi:hypothetical protein
VGSEIEGRISFQRLVKEAYLAKLSEENIKTLSIIDGRDVSVNLKPYEIKTVRICF